MGTLLCSFNFIGVILASFRLLDLKSPTANVCVCGLGILGWPTRNSTIVSVCVGCKLQILEFDVILELHGNQLIQKC